MTNHTTSAALDGKSTRAESPRNVARNAGRIALGFVIVAALAAAWLVFFTYFPLDFTPPRPG